VRAVARAPPPPPPGSITAYCILPVVCCILSIVYILSKQLLHIGCCLLSIAYCLLTVARAAVLAPVLLAPVLTVARAAVPALVLLAPVCWQHYVPASPLFLHLTGRSRYRPWTQGHSAGTPIAAGARYGHPGGTFAVLGTCIIGYCWVSLGLSVLYNLD
jgi:hypothetical protein